MPSIIRKALSEKVLGAAFAVHNTLAPGLLESAYEGALYVELKHLGLRVEREWIFPLQYRGEYIGAYIADIVVEGTIILERGSVKALKEVMEAQLINYLKLSGVPVGYPINFYKPRAEWKRFVSVSA